MTIPHWVSGLAALIVLAGIIVFAFRQGLKVRRSLGFRTLSTLRNEWKSLIAATTVTIGGHKTGGAFWDALKGITAAQGLQWRASLLLSTSLRTAIDRG